ncbi:MAG TPA: hypothetical protein VJ047_18570 [Pseudomonas sp.]|nr:hypothetical protein [Pseudomonas sp.]
MISDDSSEGSGGIGSLTIDPKAETASTPSANATGRQEIEFYDQSGKQYNLLHNQQNLGWLGKFWGASSSAPTNIAGFVIAISVVMIAASYLIPEVPDLAEGRKLFTALATSALGFVFGAATKK